MAATSSTTQPMTAQEVRAAIVALLEVDEGVFCAAVDEHGVLVPLPEALHCASPVPFVTDQALDLFAPEDWPALAQTWLEVKTEGAATLAVHLAERPDVPVELLVGDFRAEHGVILAVLRAPALSMAEIDALAPPWSPRMCVLRHDPNLLVVDVDDATTAMLGWERSELVGRRGSETVHPADLPLMHQGYISATRGDEQPRRVRVRRRRKDGTWLWVETIQVSHLGDPDPHLNVVLVDVSEEMAALTALQERETLLSSLTQALPEGLLHIDRQGRVVFTNPQLHTILRRPAGADLPGLLAALAPEGRVAVAAAITAALGGGADADLEVDLAVAPDDAGPTRCQVHVRALHATGGMVSGVLACFSDVTEATRLRRALEERARELEQRATYDALTQCHNRASVLAVLDRALGRGDHAATAVIFVDVDRFKPVNDRFGHAVGDQLLAIVAERLRGTLRGADVVGRIGGDEFLVVCHDVGDDGQAATVAERVRAALSTDMVVGDRAFHLRSSIGMARGDAGTDADELVRRADLAMYRSKRRGRGEPVLFHPALEPDPLPPECTPRPAE